MYDNIYQNILFPFYEGFLRGRSTPQHIKDLAASQWLSRDELLKIQSAELKKLLQHAGAHCEFYREAFRKAGFDPERMTSCDELLTLPILEKDDIRRNLPRMIADNYQDKTLFKSTGGSTGVPLKLGYDRGSYQWRMAVAARGYDWAGCRDGRKVVFVWGGDIGRPSLFQRQKKELYNFLLRRKVFNSFHFNDEQMARCLAFINRWKPDGIVAYTNPLYQMALWIEKNHLHVHPVPGVISAAEKVFPYQREVIERVFRTKVFNTYGCREVMLIASECEKHEGLHVNVENLFIEILKDGRPAAPGETGEVVITDLHNYAMPLIRYKNGDLAVASDHVCSCGRGLPVMADVTGRVLDVIRTLDGKTVPGEFFPHLMKEFENVRRFQVIQKGLDVVTLKMIVDRPFSSERLDFLKKEIQKVLGAATRVDVEFVDKIDLTATGKFRVTVSELEERRS